MLPDQHMNAKGCAVDGGFKHIAQLPHGLRIGAGDPGQHGIDHAHIEQECAENIAVPVDHPLTIAAQIAAPLQAQIQRFGHFLNEWRMFAVMQLKTVRILDTQFAQLVPHTIPPDQNGNAIATITELNGGT